MSTTEKDARVRDGSPSPRLSRDEFHRRYFRQFVDPMFDPMRSELERIAEIAWQAYQQGRKSPLTRKAGPQFADPEYDLSVDWIDAREAIDSAQLRHDDRSSAPRVLLINSSPRSEHTCPGEVSKSWRLIEIARDVLENNSQFEVEILDLCRLASEYGRKIYPCKACFSTAAALCHWPCSCYPNHSLGQSSDWMNEIYPMWVAAHGVMIVGPVHWYQASSPLKLMMDRLVCADGGNPDPTRTHGKDASLAKQIELAGWDYPRHLADRLFSVVIHGDAEGAEGVRRALCDWMGSIGMKSAGDMAEIDRYVGYWKPYALSHAELDVDSAFQEEVANAARVLALALNSQRQGRRIDRAAMPDEARKK